MHAASIAGISVIVVGLLLILLGIGFAWVNTSSEGPSAQPDFVRAVKELVVAIAESEWPSLGCLHLAPFLC